MDDGAPRAELGDDDEVCDARECGGLVFLCEGEIAISGLWIKATR